MKKGVIWLSFGLILSLLLVSSVVIGSQFAWPNLNYFPLAQDLKSIDQISKQVLRRINTSLAAAVASAGNNVSDLLSNQIEETKYGVMIVPSTGDTVRDEELKESLSQMFADEVNLKFDQDGRSGVVTPTFRDGRKGGDYIFVLTPLP